MKMNDLPFSLNYALQLKNTLETELDEVLSLQTRILSLTVKNTNKPYKKNEGDYDASIWKLVENFKDECYTNISILYSLKEHERYYDVLRALFDFIPQVRAKISRNLKLCWNLFENNDGEWHEKNSDTFHVSLNSWAAFLNDLVLREIEGILDSTNPFSDTKIGVVSTLTDQEREPADSDEKSLDLGVQILIANQSGILNGTFHTLPLEKQYEILGLLFGKSIGNVRNALTALYGNANTDKNPRNKPKVVEKTNNLITEKNLGIPLIIGRQKQ